MTSSHAWKGLAVQALLARAAEDKIILGLESPTKKPALDHILKELHHPNLKVYYDTGNMQGQGEDICAVIEQWGPEVICQIHLKPFESPSGIFAQGKTDIPRLAQAIKQSGYKEWFVFEAGSGKQTRGVPFAAENPRPDDGHHGWRDVGNRRAKRRGPFRVLESGSLFDCSFRYSAGPPPA